MKGLTGNISANKSFLKTWTKKGEEGMLKRRNACPGFPKSFKFDSIAEIEQYLNNEKIECLLCGRSFKSLGNHLIVHEISVSEYQEMYGLPQQSGLAGITLKEYHSKRMIRRFIENPLSKDRLRNSYAAKGHKVNISSYVLLHNKAKKEKATSKVKCKHGHDLSTRPDGEKYCKECNRVAKRRLTGGLPREVAAKTLVDALCMTCSTPMKRSRLGNKGVRCLSCKKDYMRKYDANRDKRARSEQSRSNYLKRKDKLEN